MKFFRVLLNKDISTSFSSLRMERLVTERLTKNMKKRKRRSKKSMRRKLVI